MATNTISVHTLSFAQDFSEDKLKRLTGPSDQNFYGVWHGKCIEDPDLDIVVIVGFPDSLDVASLSDTAPQRHSHSKMPLAPLDRSLASPITEVASVILKSDCDLVKVRPTVDAAMQTVLEADDCQAATWKITDRQIHFIVGWKSLEAHEKYHENIFANPPDAILAMPEFIQSNVVQHVSLCRIL